MMMDQHGTIRHSRCWQQLVNHAAYVALFMYHGLLRESFREEIRRTCVMLARQPKRAALIVPVSKVGTVRLSELRKAP